MTMINKRKYIIMFKRTPELITATIIIHNNNYFYSCTVS